MLCGDVPWEGSSRRSVSLQGSLSRGSSTCVPRVKAQPSCWRETGVSLVARFVSRAQPGRRSRGAPARVRRERPTWVDRAAVAWGRRSQGHQTVERREQLTCRGARLLQLGLAASSTRSVCPSSGLPGDASPALRPLEIDFCLRAIDSVSIDLWSRPIRERPAGRDLTGG